MKTIASLLGSLCLCAAAVSGAHADASCPKRMPEFTPVVIDGAQATLDRMRALNAEVSDYVTAAEAHLACVELHPVLQNQRLVKVQAVADQFNRELAEFRSRREALAGGNF